MNNIGIKQVAAFLPLEVEGAPFTVCLANYEASVDMKTNGRRKLK